MKKHRPRDTYKYEVMVGNKIVCRDITNDLARSETEHKKRWPDCHVVQVGQKSTCKGALKWQERANKGGDWLGEWGLWIVVTMVCYVPAFPIMAVMLSDGPVSLIILVVFAGWGAAAGLIQWFWLRRLISGAVWWIGATAVGGAIFGVICFVADTTSGGALSAAVSAEVFFPLAAVAGLAALLGTLIALSQWPLLRRWVPRASLWVPATGVSWAAGIASFIGAIDAGIRLGIGVFFVLALVGWLVIPGALTGFVLLYLLTKERDRRRK